MDGFERPEHETEFWRSLAEGRLPVKFAYSGEAAARHAMVSGYHDNVTSVETESTALSTAASWLDRCGGLCDIGPGNGYHTISLLEFLAGRGLLPERYLALDFSRELLDIAMDHIAVEFPSHPLSTAVWDFERGATTAVTEWRPDAPILALFVGSTLSNTPAPGAVLKHINRSVQSGDRLLLQLALWTEPDEESTLDSYEREFFENGILAPFRMAGIDTDVGRYEPALNRADRTVYGRFVFEEPYAVERHGNRRTFEPGETVECFRSKRFRDDEVRSLLAAANWRIVETSYSADEAFGTYLVEATD